MYDEKRLEILRESLKFWADSVVVWHNLKLAAQNETELNERCRSFDRAVKQFNWHLREVGKYNEGGKE